MYMINPVALRKVWIPEYSSLKDLIFNKFLYYRTKIINIFISVLSKELDLVLTLKNKRVSNILTNRFKGGLDHPLFMKGWSRQVILHSIAGVHQLNHKQFFCSTKSQEVAVLPFNSPDLQSPIYDLSPFFVTGFVDAEGCFSIVVQKSLKSRLGWSVRVLFSIGLHKQDLPLLKNLQAYFGGIGTIGIQGKDSFQLQISKLDQISTIIQHLTKYPLKSKKKYDYLLFKQAVDILESKRHLTSEGLQEVLNIKASLNLGLPLNLKEAFPLTTPISIPLDDDEVIPNEHPEWLSGFTSGDGHFMVKIFKCAGQKLGFKVALRFKITQDSRDELLLKSFKSFFGCGNYYSRKGGEHGDYICEKFADVLEIIIPFFIKYPIHGAKSLDFQDFRKVAELMKTKAHLTPSGLDLISQIKKGMNNGRKSKIMLDEADPDSMGNN